jgi:hypothetical protein
MLACCEEEEEEENMIMLDALHSRLRAQSTLATHSQTKAFSLYILGYHPYIDILCYYVHAESDDPSLYQSL